MTQTIVIIEQGSAIREQVLSHSELGQHLYACSSSEEALELLAEDKTVAVVLVDGDLPGVCSLTLLREARRRRPRSLGILLTSSRDYELAQGAVNGASVFRLLSKPCSSEELDLVVREALKINSLAHDELKVASRLASARESLEGFTEVLEGRSAMQTASMQRLHELALTLSRAGGLNEIAVAAAQAAVDLLQVSGARVCLKNPHGEGEVGASAGVVRDACSGADAVDAGVGHIHREVLHSEDGELGELLLWPTYGPAVGAEFPSPRDRGKLNLIITSTVVAVGIACRRGELDAAQQATIIALAGLSDQRDSETGLHLERVAAYCRVLAEGLMANEDYQDYIKEQFIDHLVRSSPLHDIGKVAIPDSILLNPGKLSLEEEAVMRTHTTIGAETLAGVMVKVNAHGFLAMGRDIAHCHHEYWDGRGYPRGLAGTEIPLSARILALADVYDALTTERRYKPAWDHERVVPWISALAGRQFDPDLVAVFLKREDEFNAIREHLKNGGELIREPSIEASRAQNPTLDAV